MSILRRPIGGWGEFFLVVFGAFGIFVVWSFIYAFRVAPYGGHSTGSFWYLIAYEVTVLILLGTLLHQRGWTAANLGLRLRWWDILLGLGLAIIVALCDRGLFWILSHTAPQLLGSAGAVIRHGITPLSALGVVVVNPFFEELFVSGYIIAALKRGHHT